MSDVTRILEAMERGEGLVPEQLLPLRYGELRRKMPGENPVQARTALIHEV
jgi:hypothetical protein